MRSLTAKGQEELYSKQVMPGCRGHKYTVLLVRLLQASSGVWAATPYGVVTLVELPVDNVRFTPGGPVICNESLHIGIAMQML